MTERYSFTVVQVVCTLQGCAPPNLRCQQAENNLYIKKTCSHRVGNMFLTLAEYGGKDRVLVADFESDRKQTYSFTVLQVVWMLQGCAPPNLRCQQAENNLLKKTCSHSFLFLSPRLLSGVVHSSSMLAKRQFPRNYCFFGSFFFSRENHDCLLQNLLHPPAAVPQFIPTGDGRDSDSLSGMSLAFLISGIGIFAFS